MFHVSDGLYFEDKPDGSVRIIKRETGHADAPVIFDITLGPSSWASVIASMSYYGEEDGGFYRAIEFHSGESLPPGVRLVDKKDYAARPSGCVTIQSSGLR